jgi:hypothetical protein
MTAESENVNQPLPLHLAGIDLNGYGLQPRRYPTVLTFYGQFQIVEIHAASLN